MGGARPQRTIKIHQLTPGRGELAQFARLLRVDSASDRASSPQRLGPLLELVALDGFQRLEHGPLAMAVAEVGWASNECCRSLSYRDLVPPYLHNLSYKASISP